LNKNIVYGLLFFEILFISGCSSTEDYYIQKDTTNLFNSYFASGLSCSGFYGSNLIGLDGSVNRQLNVSNFPLIIVVDTFYLNNGYDYSFSNINTTYVVTFNNAIWNDQEIGICLATSNTTWSNSVYLGINCTGSDGDVNRVLVSNITFPILVSVDNWLLSSGFDYTLSSSNITFLNPVWDDMVISVWG